MFTEDLDDYLSAEPTTSCYLDGRYFYKILLNYPGTIAEPLRIFISRRGDGELQAAAQMNHTNINLTHPGLLRVVIQTPTSRHCNLLILDYEKGIAYRFEPYGIDSPAEAEINTAIENYLAFFLNMKVNMLDITAPEVANPSCLARGEKSGFCTAYIIMMAYAYLNEKPYRFDEPARFASYVEQQYGTLPKEGAEIEYGIFDKKGFQPDAGKMALGGIIGLGAGGLLGGTGGAAIGGLGGLAVGSLL